jgi:hypothetical protein
MNFSTKQSVPVPASFGIFVAKLSSNKTRFLVG